VETALLQSINVGPGINSIEDLAARFITSRQVLGYEDEAAVLAAAREWIDDCRHSHDCTWPSSGSNSVTLPSRLIDVGDDTIAPDVRLHTTRSGETLEYVALSYCWGGPQPVTTTLANLGSMEQRIPLTKLPKTLQYAVRLTRSVGQRYLWVDALCIIQDSGEDMRREIQKMGSIYRNAVFTISAARASKVSEGFLGRQPESTPLPSVRWQLDIPGMGMHTIFISTWYGQPGYWPKHPLDRRGWTLQESMLSPRLMVFSEYEPIWHCRAVQGKTAKASVIEYANLSRRLPDWFFAEQADPDNPWKFSRIQMPALWESIVKNFTGRALTNKEDRLDAVAGISAELQRRSKDDYFYGHWRECFVRQLLWHVFPSSVSLEERRRRAPTWSWGSVDGTVYYDIGSLTLQDEATAQVTVNAAGGFPRVWVTLKIKRRDAFANEPVKCHFDLADQDSDPPSDAVMLFLATSTLVRRSDAGYGIICVQSNKQSDTLQRIGYFEPRDVPTEELRDSGIWEGVELRQILLE
jgi:hypothetical protein